MAEMSDLWPAVLDSDFGCLADGLCVCIDANPCSFSTTLQDCHQKDTAPARSTSVDDAGVKLTVAPQLRTAALFVGPVSNYQSLGHQAVRRLCQSPSFQRYLEQCSVQQGLEPFEESTPYKIDVGQQNTPA